MLGKTPALITLAFAVLALTLASAAHALRQHAVDYNDFKGWRLSRELRDADTFSQAVLAEQKLNTWLAATACEKELLHYCV